jgi:hypothetical protein
MKKSNNIISDWLDKYGDPEIDKQVEWEIENGIKSPLVDVSTQEMVNFERSPQLSLYSKIEYLIIMWSNDGTKTAGTLTRQIMELLKNK